MSPSNGGYREGKREETHRQNSQQRRLAGILQTDHGDIHLGGPAHDEQLVKDYRKGHRSLSLLFGLGVEGVGRYQMPHEMQKENQPGHVADGGESEGGGDTYQNRRKSQS